MKQTFIDTPLGQMIALADDSKLYLLAFTNYSDKHYIILKNQIQSEITSGITEPIRIIKKELDQYFSGKLIKFATPIDMVGTKFQLSVWEALKQIPLGQTRSYADIARMIGAPNAYRAVGMACNKNKLAIIIPCHRVINSSGRIGGYNGHLHLKQWLMVHEFEIRFSLQEHCT